jgi:hypothetical protein
MSNILRKLNRNKQQTIIKEIRHRKVLERIQIEKTYNLPHYAQMMGNIENNR